MKNELKKQRFAIVDYENNLEWLIAYDKEMTCRDATAWANSFGIEWRLPTILELATISKEIFITIFYTNFGWYVWSCDAQGEQAAAFHMKNREIYYTSTDSVEFVTFAVRMLEE